MTAKAHRITVKIAFRPWLDLWRPFIVTFWKDGHLAGWNGPHSWRSAVEHRDMNLRLYDELSR